MPDSNMSVTAPAVHARAGASRALGFPKQTDGKRMVKEERASRPPQAASGPNALFHDGLECQAVPQKYKFGRKNIR